MVPVEFNPFSSKPTVGVFHGARYLTNLLFIDLEATVGTYELRSYGGEQ